MSRVKRGVISAKRRRNVLSQVKGYRFARSRKERAAKDAIVHAGSHAFAHRRDKKNDMRRLWTVRLNAALRPMGLSYSKFIDALKKKGIILDRKVLSEIAKNKPESFTRIANTVK